MEENKNDLSDKYSFLKEYYIIPQNTEVPISESEYFLQDSNKTVVAIDNSGSTTGKILSDTKKIIKDIFEGCPYKEQILSNIIAWNHKCDIKHLDDIESNGGTDPSVLFEVLKETHQNMIITTDGEISHYEVSNTANKIKLHPHLKNIIAILFDNNYSYKKKPANLEISVFYPFLEHVKKYKGSFYLFCYYMDKIYLLIKNIPSLIKSKDNLPDTVKEYNTDLEFKDIPEIKIEDLRKIEVLKNYEHIDDEGIKLEGIKYKIDFNKFYKDIMNFKEKKINGFLGDDNFSAFMNDKFIEILQYLKDNGISKKEYDELREIVKEYQRVRSEIIQDEIIKNTEFDKVREYEELVNKKVNMMKSKRQAEEEYKILLEKINILRKELLPSINIINKLKQEKLKSLNQFCTSMLQTLSEDQNKMSDNNEMKDYSLQNVTKAKIANRVKRANIVIAPTKETDWVLTGENNLLIDECPICCQENQQCALLMIDIAEENQKLLEYNLSDYALNDELFTGTKNICALPSGELCLHCALIFQSLGYHPLTRQKVKSVLALCDPSIQQNMIKINDAVCSSIFNGHQVAFSMQLLLGLFDNLQKKEFLDNNNDTRFSSKIYSWIQKYALFNSKGNLLPENIGNTKILLEAMYDLVFYPFSQYISDNFLIPLRNKNLASMSIICRNLFVYYNDINKINKELKIDINQLKRISVDLMRRIFIKNILTKISNICKKRMNFTEEDIKLYDDFCFSLEYDLFNTKITNIPVIDSEHIIGVEESKMLKIIFNKDEYDNMMQEINYFEIKYKEKFNESLNIITKKMITVLEAILYYKFKDEEIYKSLSINVENFILLLLNFEQEDIKDEIEGKLNIHFSSIFFKGHKGYVERLSDNEIISIIKSIAPYRKIIRDNKNSHNEYVAYASHLYSPVVTRCCICGKMYILESEIEQIKKIAGTKNFKKDKSILNIINKIKKRKAEHMNEFFNTDINTYLPTENSCITSYHKIVRETCCMTKFENLEKPSRLLIEEEIKNARNQNQSKRGNIYKNDLIKSFIILSYDFLKKRKQIKDEGKKLPDMDLFPFIDRVIIEINENQDKYIGAKLDYGDLTQDEINELTKPFE